MKNTIDREIITPEFLLKYFPSPSKYHEQSEDNLLSTLEMSKQRYLKVKTNINNQRKRSGKSQWFDRDIVDFITQAEGYLQMPNILKKNN